MVRLIVLIVLALLVSQCTLPRRSSPKPEGGWPNPFSPTSSINLREFVGQYVTVTVFNIRGENVGVAHDGILDSVGKVDMTEFVRVTLDSAGTPDTTMVSDSSLTSGVYFYRVKTQDTVFTKKMVLMR
jgi:hypothetical protein